MNKIFPVSFSGNVVGYRSHFAKAGGYHKIKVTLSVDPNTLIREVFDYYEMEECSTSARDVELVAYVGPDEDAAYQITDFLRACTITATRINSANIERMRQGRLD